MAAQSGGFWRAGGTVALCGFWLLTGLLPGEFTPVAAEPPAVEMWQGNRRVGQPTPTAPVPLTLQPVPGLLPRPAVSSLEHLGQTLPPIRASDLPAPTAVQRPTFTPPPPARSIKPRIRTEPWHRHLLQASHHLLNDCENAVNACVGRVSTSTGTVVEALAEVTEQSMTGPGTSTVPGPLATTPDERPSYSGAAPGVPAGEPAWPWVQIATLAFVVTMPFALVVGLALILRWSGMKFRVEIINSGAVLLQDVQGLRALAPAVPQAPAGQPDLDQLWQTGLAGGTAADPHPLDAPAEEVFTGEYFDLGPTFEEERLLREEALLAGERAVLQQVYEENLRLQQEIRELGPDLDDDLPAEEEAPVGYTTPPDADECTEAA